MKRNIKTYALLALRRWGMICRKPRPTKPGLKIAYTVYPDERLTPIDSEIYVYLETKKMSYKNCKFDPSKRTCECGVSLDSFGAAGCPNKKSKYV